MQYSTWGLTREEQRGTNTSFARLATSLLMQPRMELTFSVHTDGSCKSFHALEPPEPSPQEKFSMTSSPSLHMSGISPTQVQHPALGVFEPHSINAGPFPKLAQVQVPLL